MAWTESVWDMLFPRRCLACRARCGSFLCPACAEEVVRRERTDIFCSRCRGRLPDGRNRCHPDYPPTAALGDYSEKLFRDAVHLLKFSSVFGAAEIFGDLLGDLAARTGQPIDLVIPVPLSSKRLRERGYNQSELLSRSAAKRLGRPLVTEVLQRAKDSPPQSTIADPRRRADNIANVFDCHRPEKIRGQNILLIDDVVTTGATLGEAARTLRRTGSGAVFAVVLARA